MKHAFALRMNLGDPGPDPGNPFVNVTKQNALLDDILSRKYADGLRWVPGIQSCVIEEASAQCCFRRHSVKPDKFVYSKSPAPQPWPASRQLTESQPRMCPWLRNDAETAGQVTDRPACLMLTAESGTSVRRSDIQDDRTQPPENYGGQWNVLRAPPQDHGTCHFSIVGGNGMAVAMTTTVIVRCVVSHSGSL